MPRGGCNFDFLNEEDLFAEDMSKDRKKSRTFQYATRVRPTQAAPIERPNELQTTKLATVEDEGSPLPLKKDE